MEENPSENNQVPPVQPTTPPVQTPVPQTPQPAVQPQPVTPVIAGDTNEDNKATGSLILGVISLASWLIPLIGIIGLAGIYLSVKGLKSMKRSLAIVGMILSIAGILLAVVKFTNGTDAGLISTEDTTTDSQAIDDAIQGESMEDSTDPTFFEDPSTDTTAAETI